VCIYDNGFFQQQQTYVFIVGLSSFSRSYT
jgi:hypothetical protein